MNFKFAFLLTIALLPSWGQSALPAASSLTDVSLHLATKGGKTTFYIGESIDVELQFQSTDPTKYAVWTVRPERQAREPEFDHFTIEPGEKVTNPLADIFTQVANGLATGVPPRPVALTTAVLPVGLHMNEWVSIRQPGHYRVTAESTRVVATAAPTVPVPLKSTNVVEIDVIAPPPGWAETQLHQAILTLQIPDPPRSVIGQSIEGDVEQSQRNAAIRAGRTLRFLETPEAAPALAKFYDHGPAYAQSELRLGLFASPYRKEVIAAMEEQLAAPDVPISYSYLGALTELAMIVRYGPSPTFNFATASSEDIQRHVREVERPYLERTKPTEAEYFAKLNDAIPQKQGSAREVSLQTLARQKP